LTQGYEDCNAAGTQEVPLAIEVFVKGGASMDSVADLALFLASDARKKLLVS